MPRIDFTIETRDGLCPSTVITPNDIKDPWPAVIFFMDGFGIRPAMLEMARRLSEGGYLVLLPDLYYRMKKFQPTSPSQLQTNPELREELIKNVSTLNSDRKVSDAGAFIEYLLSRTDVKGDRFGVTGYCMGGNTALTAAGAYPGRFRRWRRFIVAIWLLTIRTAHIWEALFKLLQDTFSPEL